MRLSREVRNFERRAVTLPALRMRTTVHSCSCEMWI